MYNIHFFKKNIEYFLKSNLLLVVTNQLARFFAPKPSAFNLSSNINEAIRAVSNFLFCFLRKDFAHTKSTKSTKSIKRHKGTQAQAQNANKQVSDYFPLRCFLGAVFVFVRV